MAQPHRQSEAQYRDDILTLKDDFVVAIAEDPKSVEWVLLDSHDTPIWWKYANGDLEHELRPATSQESITTLLSVGRWRRIHINQSTKQHRERMLFTYGAQPMLESYDETTDLEFAEVPDPDLVLPIFRLYDLTNDRLDEYGDERKTPPYIALSHVWNQSSDASLRAACTRAQAATGHTRFWVDRWCIKQTSIEDKAFHVPRMRDYYTHAVAVLIVVPDLRLPPDTTNDEAFVENLRRTRWFSRVWTFQEAMSSKRLMLDDGARYWNHATVEGHVRRCHGERARLQRPDIINDSGMLRLNDDLWIDAQGRLTMAISEILYSTGGRLWNLIVEEEKAKVSLTRLIHQTQYRRCRLAEDRFYGLMGLAHATADVRVEYGIGFTRALLKAAASGALDSKILAGNSVSPLAGACWLPDTSSLGRQETLQQLSSQGRQTLTPGARGIQVWCARKKHLGELTPHVENWVVKDNSIDKIVLSLVNSGNGLYHRVESRIESRPETVGEAMLLEVGNGIVE